jgi:hypothetical protein
MRRLWLVTSFAFSFVPMIFLATGSWRFAQEEEEYALLAIYPVCINPE